MDTTKTETVISDTNGVCHSTTNGNCVPSKSKNNGHGIALNSKEPNRKIQALIYNTIFFLLKLVICISLWIVMISCVIIPITPFALVYYTLKLIEEYIYRFYYGGEGLTGADALWMQDGPKNLTIVHGLLVADEPSGEVANTKLRKAIQEKFVQGTNKDGKRLYSRSTKYVHAGIFNYFWMEDKNFAVEDHVYLSAVEAKSKGDLRKIISEYCSSPLNLKPGSSPWEYIVIPWSCDDVRKVAILFRAHHSMADGVSLAWFLTNQLPDNIAKGLVYKKFSERDRFLLFTKGLFWSPIYIGKQFLRWSDRSILHGQVLSGKKNVTWSEPVDLNLVKRIKNATKTTVNDVLVSCLAGTLVKYFQTKDIKQPENIALSMPVDLRKNLDQDAIELANKFGILHFKLPTGLNEPLKMLHETRARMDVIKTSGEPFALDVGMALGMAVLPECIAKPLLRFICEKTTGVLSNVPGPQNTIRIAGRSLEVVTFWPPSKDNIGMSFSICSYANKVFFAVQCDEAILEDPDEICSEFVVQIENLKNHCNLLKID